MKKIILLVVLLLCVPFFLFAQNYKRAFKKLEKNELEEAYSDFTQMNTEFPNNPIIHYGIAKLLINKEFSKFNLFQSFYYSSIAYNNKDSFPQTEYDKLTDILTITDIENLWREANLQLFTHITTTDNIDLTKKFLSECKTSIYFKAAEELWHRQEFALAENVNTVQAYQFYIDRFPQAIEATEAKKRRNEIAFQQAIENNTVIAYNEFIQKFPDATQISLAIQKRNKLAFDNAVYFGSIDSYQDFITKYPNAEQIQLAIQKRNTLAYEKTLSIGTTKALEDFMEQYPDSEQYETANNKRAEMLLGLTNQIRTEIVLTLPENEQFINLNDDITVANSTGIFLAAAKETAANGTLCIYVNQQKISNVSVVPNSLVASGTNYAYAFYVNNKVEMNVNGKVICQFDELVSPVKFHDDKNFSFIYKKAGKLYRNVNGTDFIHSLNEPITFLNTDKYEIQYQNQKYFLRTAFARFGPYDSIMNVKVVSFQKYLFSYISNKKAFVNISSEIFGGFDEVNNAAMSDDGMNFIFTYKLNNEYCVNVNKTVFCGFDFIYGNNISANLAGIDLTGTYHYSFTAGNSSFIHFAGKETMPLNAEILKIAAADSNFVAQIFDENYAVFLNNNTFISGENIIFSNNAKHYFSYLPEEKKIIIDGKIIDNYFGTAFVYDKVASCVTWLRVEGRNLIRCKYCF